MAAVVTGEAIKPLDVFVAYAYWAKVRMPSERCISPGVIAIPEQAASMALTETETLH